jgi:hypothetical protein
MLSTRPEDELLICCARNSIDPKITNRLNDLVKKNIDWQYLIQTAQCHGVTPLLYRSLNNTCSEAVPETVLKTLQEHFEANDRRNLFLTGELIKLLYLFENNSIPAIPFKGPTLAASIYGDLALRQFSDLDILVQKQDILKVRDLLVSSGYTPEFQFKKAQVETLLKYQYEFPFIHKSGRIFVEVQWELVPRYLNCTFVSKHLWKHFRPVVGSSGLPIIPPEYLLLMLCIHGTKDFWARLIWVSDVAELVRVHGDMAWDFVINLAGNLGCQRMLFLGLFLAKSLLGSFFPDMALQTIEADQTVKRLAEQVRQRLFQEDDGLPGVEKFLFYLKSKERLQDKILYCQRLITTISPHDWAFLPLPSSLSFFYYLIRPVRLAAKYVLKPSRGIPDYP